MGLMPRSPGVPRDRIAVMVSELATNAILHGMTEFEVTVDIRHDLLRVEVADLGTGTPVVRPLPLSTTERGRGLRIVREFSDHWGVEKNDPSPGKSVWFQLLLDRVPAPV
jgi:anti-sigma regulatory factor (Ser/Thr protein kinase)